MKHVVQLGAVAGVLAAQLACGVPKVGVAVDRSLGTVGFNELHPLPSAEAYVVYGPGTLDFAGGLSPLSYTFGPTAGVSFSRGESGYELSPRAGQVKIPKEYLSDAYRFYPVLGRPNDFIVEASEVTEAQGRITTAMLGHRECAGRSCVMRVSLGLDTDALDAAPSAQRCTPDASTCARVYSWASVVLSAPRQAGAVTSWPIAILYRPER